MTARPIPALPLVALLSGGLFAISLSGPSLACETEGQRTRALRKAGSLPRVEMPAPEVVLPMLAYGNRPQVELSINGGDPVRFILDTGAGGSVVDKGLAEELGLPVVGEQRLMSPVGEKAMSVSRVRMEKAGIAGITLHGLEAATMDLASYFRSSDGPRGVLSSRVFTGLLLSFDYPGDRLVVRQGSLGAADGKEIFQFNKEETFITIPVSVAGTTVNTHIDTGSPSAITLPGRYAETLPLKSEPAVIGRARLVDGEVDILGAQLEGTMAIGRHTFENPQVKFADKFPAGNIGYGILRDFELTLDWANARVRLTRSERTSPASRIASSPQRRRYGVAFRGIEQSPLVVAGVDPGSAADESGLQIGDRIVEMNGKALEALGVEERIGMLRASPLALVVDRDGERIEIQMSL